MCERAAANIKPCSSHILVPAERFGFKIDVVDVKTTAADAAAVPGEQV